MAFLIGSFYPWLTEDKRARNDLRTIVYARNSTDHAKRRLDAIEYIHSDETRTGILQLLVEGVPQTGRPKLKIAIVRRLVQNPPHEDNKKAVEDFLHLRFAYDISEFGRRDVKVDCVLQS